MADNSGSAARTPGVRHRRVDLPQHTDSRGRLGFAEEGAHIPFAVRRLFYLYEIPRGAARGGHAHRVQHQFLLMIHGACTVRISDGVHVTSEVLDSPATGLYIPPLLWLDLVEFTTNAVCLVLASDRYDESDYIRDPQEFIRLTSQAEPGA